MKEILIERFIEANTGLCKIYEYNQRSEKVFLERIFCEDSAWDYAERLLRKSGEEGIIYYKKVKHKSCGNCQHFKKLTFQKCFMNGGSVWTTPDWCHDFLPKEGVL